MRTDLRHSFEEGMNYLATWRNRYSKSEYPEKVVLNVFYRKYTMEFIFSEIIGCYEKNFWGMPKTKWPDFNVGFAKLKEAYSNCAMAKTQPVLMSLLSQSQRNVGNTNYSVFTPLIAAAKAGDTSKLEEIEYAYLYYLLADECILLWGAIGGTGLTKIETIGRMSGVLIETKEDIKNYAQIEQTLGKFCAAPYLAKHYKPLPPMREESY